MFTIRSGPGAGLPVLLGLLLLMALGAVGGCATRAADVVPRKTDASEFAGWTCARIADESDRVQQRAAEVAWIVDERAGQHVVALGVGIAIFWPALLAMRPDGVDAEELARLKGRHEALLAAGKARTCPPAPEGLAPDRLAVMPVFPGERLVYEDRPNGRDALVDRVLAVVAFRRDEIELQFETPPAGAVWRQDLAGNVIEAPVGALVWERLLKHDLELGQVVAGELRVRGDPLQRARVRGQVIALGPQNVAGRRFDVAVIQLFGEVAQGESSTRLEGALVVDRASGILLRLDLRSAQPPFALQRRLVRVAGGR